MLHLNNQRSYRHGIGEALSTIEQYMGLPVIRGRWMIVDPYATDRDYLFGAVVPDLQTGYDELKDERGDGLIVMSGGTSTSAQTSTYLKKPMVWSKHDITVLGVEAGGFFGRARITSKSISTSGVACTMTAHTIVRASGSFISDNWIIGSTGYCASSGGTSNANNTATFTVTKVEALTLTFTETFTVQTAAECGTVVLTAFYAPLITVSGENNHFLNLHVSSGIALASSLGGVSVQANRNKFSNCHIIGAGHATAAAVADTQFDLELAASECEFNGCYFGTNSTLYAAANGHIKLGKTTTQIGQNFFRGCHVISNSATAGHGAIYVTDTATLGGWIFFEGCQFVNWQSGAKTALTTAIIGATPDNCGIYIDATSGMVGWAAWSANNDKFVTCGAAGAAGTGGIGGTIA